MCKECVEIEDQNRRENEIQETQARAEKELNLKMILYDAYIDGWHDGINHKSDEGKFETAFRLLKKMQDLNLI